MVYKTFENIISKKKIKQAFAYMNTVFFNHKECKLDLSDGYFFPFPYSTIHDSSAGLSLAMKQYFVGAKIANSLYFPESRITLSEWFIDLVRTQMKREILPLKYQEHKFASFGLRFLKAGKNGIDIHCENAFLHQLSPLFKDWLYEKLNIENIWSFFLVLQKPTIGGELIIFNKSWDHFKLELDSSTYEERHDIEGSLFTNRGAEKPDYELLVLNAGDGVLFSAAKYWHSINKIGGERDRITIGCFIGEGKDGKLYCWA